MPSAVDPQEFFPAGEIHGLIAQIRALVQQREPQLLPLYDVFAGEAVFARAWLSPHLAKLVPGAELLEVGAGLMLLSCQLAREGWRMTALEPVGIGFSDFHRLQVIVRANAEERGIAIRILPIPVEVLIDESLHDFAFSVNVMEHVGNVSLALERITRALQPGGTYAFVCPNYLFPYEPHFGLPILVSKRLTERVFRHTIRESKRVPDPVGLWESLNWITVRTIRRTCAQLGDVELKFDQSFLARSFERVTSEPEFASRRAAWMRGLSRILVATRLHRLSVLIPPALQPVIDCTVQRQRPPRLSATLANGER